MRRYVADERLGGPAGLAAARAALADRGLRLILDYVPNHVAPDHPWVIEHPEYFVRGTTTTSRPSRPPGCGRPRVLAHGRDPYFPPWPDVVQLNAYSPGAAGGDRADAGRHRRPVRRHPLRHGDADDQRHLRPDLGRAGRAAPDEEFWPAVIAELRAGHPDTVLIAEAYWDMEWTLQQQGFEFCYDKRLYDRIVGGDPADVRGHLQADLGYQSRLVRFLENHDEPRVARRCPPAERAAAVTVATLPGATLWHEGQFEGRRVRLPVFLARRPGRAARPGARRLAPRLVAVVAEQGVRTGAWQLLEAGGWPDNQSCRNLIAWSWTPGDDAGASAGT